MQSHTLSTKVASRPYTFGYQRGSISTRLELGPGSFWDPPLVQHCMVVRTGCGYHRTRDAAEWAAPGPHVECAAPISAAGDLIEGCISRSHLYGGRESSFHCTQYSRTVPRQHTIHFGGAWLWYANHQHEQWSSSYKRNRESVRLTAPGDSFIVCRGRRRDTPQP